MPSVSLEMSKYVWQQLDDKSWFCVMDIISNEAGMVSLLKPQVSRHLRSRVEHYIAVNKPFPKTINDFYLQLNEV